MDIFEAIILGAVQGLTEFLPVSSSGHLVLLQKIFGIDSSNLIIDIALHIATLGAVVFVFRKKIIFLLRHPFSPLGKCLIISTIPTIILVLVFKSFIESSFGGNFFVYGFAITAMILLLTELGHRTRITPQSKNTSQSISKNSVSIWRAFIMGIAQGIAVLPGVSRSGATICVGLLSGCNRDEVAEFSFLMSVPVILASLCYEIIFAPPTISIDWGMLILGMVVAFLVGLLAIKFMIYIVRKASLTWFAIYLVFVIIFCGSCLIV